MFSFFGTSNPALNANTFEPRVSPIRVCLRLARTTDIAAAQRSVMQLECRAHVEEK